MNPKNTLKYPAIFLLVEAIILALKHPIILWQAEIGAVIGQNMTDGLISCYETYFVWVQVLIYYVFCNQICELDREFSNSRFGRYFIFDMIMVLLSALITTIGIDKTIIYHSAKTAIELISIGTSIMAGYYIWRNFRNQSVLLVFLSYFLLSVRHLTYAILLVITILSQTGRNNPEFSDGTIIRDWLLLMPILLLSRILLVKGFFKMANDE